MLNICRFYVELGEGLRPNVISYSAAIAACRDRPETVLSLLSRMRSEGVAPNTVVLSTAINSLSRIGTLSYPSLPYPTGVLPNLPYLNLHFYPTLVYPNEPYRTLTFPYPILTLPHLPLTLPYPYLTFPELMFSSRRHIHRHRSRHSDGHGT